MAEIIEQAVLRAIARMRENLGEPLSLDEMARAAMYSKFHFSRAFQRATGVSPGRFLAAIRLEEAKRLLVSTSLTVTEISHRVGYTSVGTFGSRFTSAVGVSPTSYRECRGYAPALPLDERRGSVKGRGATVRGEVWHPGPAPDGPIFLGLFRDRIPQGRPVHCAMLPTPGPFVLEGVPQGEWHLLAHSVPREGEEAIQTRSEGEYAVSIGAHALVTIRPDTIMRIVDVRLRPLRTIDPPVLLALLDVRTRALSPTR